MLMFRIHVPRPPVLMLAFQGYILPTDRPTGGLLAKLTLYGGPASLLSFCRSRSQLKLHTINDPNQFGLSE